MHPIISGPLFSAGDWFIDTSPKMQFNINIIISITLCYESAQGVFFKRKETYYDV